MTALKSLRLSTAIVVAGMIAGRVSGFFREVIVAHQFGKSRAADLVVFGLGVPDLLTAMVVGGASAAALIPEYNRLLKAENHRASNDMLMQFLVLATGVACLITAVLYVFSEQILYAMAPGFMEEPQTRELGITIFRITIIAFPMGVANSILTAGLQASEAFTMPAFGTAVYNGVILIVLLLPMWRGDLIWISWGAVFAGLARLLSHMGSSLRHGHFNITWKALFRWHRLQRQLILNYLQAFGAVSLPLLTPVITRAFSSMAQGDLAAVNWAQKLVELPRGVFIAALSTVLFSRISTLFAQNDAAAGFALARKGMVLVWLSTFPVVVCFLIASVPLSAVAYMRGQITESVVEQIALLAQVSFVALPFFGLISLAMSLFHARQNMLYPFLTSVGALVVHFILTWVLWDWMQAPGLVLAVTIVTILQALALVIEVRRRYGIWLVDRGALRDILWISAFSAAGGAVVYGCSQLLANRWALAAVAVAVSVAVMLVSFFAGLKSVPSQRIA